MRFSSPRPLGIDPCVDVVFHKLLGSPENEDILVAFLNDVLDDPTPIRQAKLKNPFAPGLYRGERDIVLDVLAVDERGRQQAIEMQRRRHDGLEARMVYGQSRAYAGQLRKGQSYDALRPTTSIWLCGEDVFPELGAMLRFRIREAQGKVLEEGWRIELLQLAKWFTEREALLAERFGPWYAFFNEAETWTEVPPHLARPELEKAMHVLDDFQKDPDLDQIYRGRLELERIRLTEQERLAEAIRAREESDRAREADARAREEAERGRKEAERGREAEARARKEAELGREAEARAREESDRAREESDRAREQAERRSEADARAREEAERASVAHRAEIERLRAELRNRPRKGGS